MWKLKANEKNSATASDAIMPRSLTSKTNGGTSSFSDNNISQSSDKIKPLSVNIQIIYFLNRYI